MNIRIQIPSTRVSPRGLASPRRNLISTRLLSPSRRIKEIQKLPSLDTRSLLGNPNLEYAQPAYILEQKLHLIPEVESLRKEVSLLRENYQLILASFKGTNDDSTQNENDNSMYDEMAQYELSKKLSQCQAEVDELERRISNYNNTLTEQTEIELNNYVTNQRQMKTKLEDEIEMSLILIEEKNELLAETISADYTEKVDANHIKISHLSQLLFDLQEEEKLMLQLHQDKCKSDQPGIETNQEVNSYLRKLQMLQHTHARKLVDLKKLQKEHQQEKIALLAVKQSREETEKKRKERIASQLIYKKRAAILEENSRAISKISENEEKQKLTTTKRRKHKHKHWHHRRQNEGATENDKNVQNDIVVDEGADLIQKPTPVTFKTEVEKVNSLCIGDGTE